MHLRHQSFWPTISSVSQFFKFYWYFKSPQQKCLNWCIFLKSFSRQWFLNWYKVYLYCSEYFRDNESWKNTYLEKVLKYQNSSLSIFKVLPSLSSGDSSVQDVKWRKERAVKLKTCRKTLERNPPNDIQIVLCTYEVVYVLQKTSMRQPWVSFIREFHQKAWTICGFLYPFKITITSNHLPKIRITSENFK